METSRHILKKLHERREMTKPLREGAGSKIYGIGIYTTNPESGPSPNDYDLLFGFRADSDDEAASTLERFSELVPLQDESNEEPNDTYDERDRYNSQHRGTRSFTNYSLASNQDYILKSGVEIYNTSDPEELAKRYNDLSHEDDGPYYPDDSSLDYRGLDESSGGYEVAWREFDRNDTIVTKTKEFSSQKALDKFVEKLTARDNFYEIYGYRYPEKDLSERRYPTSVSEATAKELPTYTIKIQRVGMSRTYPEKYKTGTLPELVSYFSYVLASGHSYNSSVSTNPKSIQSLVNSLNRANAATTTHFRSEYYELVDNPPVVSESAKLREGARREDIIGEIARRYEDNDGSEDIEEFCAQRGIEGDLQDSDIKVHLRKLSSKDLGELMGLLGYEGVQVSESRIKESESEDARILPADLLTKLTKREIAALTDMYGSDVSKIQEWISDGKLTVKDYKEAIVYYDLTGDLTNDQGTRLQKFPIELEKRNGELEARLRQLGITESHRLRTGKKLKEARDDRSLPEQIADIYDRAPADSEAVTHIESFITGILGDRWDDVLIALQSISEEELWELYKVLMRTDTAYFYDSKSILDLISKEISDSSEVRAIEPSRGVEDFIVLTMRNGKRYSVRVQEYRY